MRSKDMHMVHRGGSVQRSRWGHSIDTRNRTYRLATEIKASLYRIFKEAL